MTWVTCVKSLGILLYLLFVGSCKAQLCNTQRSISPGCDCHFIGACDWSTSPPTPIANPATARPQNTVTFAANGLETTDICEGVDKSLAIYYDCHNRIPLYTARVLPDADITAPYSSKCDRSSGFRESLYINKLFSQSRGDYGPRGRDQVPCYEKYLGNPKGSMFVDTKWFPSTTTTCGARTQAKKTKATIDKGHMISASYGRSAAGKQSVRDTFVYTNAVPQFSKLNRGQWCKYEQKLIAWAQSNCASTQPAAKSTRRSARLFVVVGSIPSNYARFEERWFGFPGFSDFKGKSQKKGLTQTRSTDYMINVPSVMWTAACCEFQSNAGGMWADEYISTAFWSTNSPYLPQVTASPVPNLFSSICSTAGSGCPVGTPPNINIFPLQPQCTAAGAYIAL